jgi:mevalonate kinase
MAAITATAPGKAILVGEHAVVYARPAIAVPVTQVQARAAVFADPHGQAGEVWGESAGNGRNARLSQLPATHVIVRLFALLAAELSIPRFPALHLKISSTIPIAAGLGSGAAVSVACLRALSAFVGHPLPNERISALAYEQEKIFHLTPSGIDNTVIAYAQPIYFVRAQPFELLHMAAPLTLVIADTGIRSSTAAAVGGVRQRWQQDPPTYEHLFDQIGEISIQARACLESGLVSDLGPLLDENHRLLLAAGVSCPELDRLIAAARQNGALGAKLCGGGLGGNMIALVEPAQSENVAAALRSAGAVRTWTTSILPQ